MDGIGPKGVLVGVHRIGGRRAWEAGNRIKSRCTRGGDGLGSRSTFTMQALTQRNDTRLFPGLLPCLDARDHFGTWPTTCFLFLLQAENPDRQSGFRGMSQGSAVNYVRHNTQVQRWELGRSTKGHGRG